jgi:uncharacterized repeat protein (TIGR04138 family)
MLCEECNQREAMIHITKVAGDVTTNNHYCSECGQKYVPTDCVNLEEVITKQQKVKYLLTEKLRRDTGYSVAAFEFVQEAVSGAHRSGEMQNISARELLEVLRVLAAALYGKSAKSVLAGWGIHRTEDFGEIVFTLIDFGLLNKREEDRREDFANGYNFDEVFPEN